jgi:hypothetical protein
MAANPFKSYSERGSFFGASRMPEHGSQKLTLAGCPSNPESRAKRRLQTQLSPWPKVGEVLDERERDPRFPAHGCG